MNRSFKVFNIDKTKNKEVIRFILLKLEINVVVIGLNSIGMFLEYDLLVKYNLKVNKDKEMIWFTRYPKNAKHNIKTLHLHQESGE